jgi:hypothetical protein
VLASAFFGVGLLHATANNAAQAMLNAVRYEILNTEGAATVLRDGSGVGVQMGIGINGSG